MKLYTFDINDMIAECEVVEETPTKYKYKYSYNVDGGYIPMSIKKTSVDTPLLHVTNLSLRRLMATSKKKLLDIAVESLNASINTISLDLAFFKDKRDRVISKIKDYDKNMEA